MGFLHPVDHTGLPQNDHASQKSKYFCSTIHHYIGLFWTHVTELARVSETLHQLSHSGSLLSNSNVDTVQLLLLIRTLVETPLVDDGVDGNSSFTIKQNI